MLNKSINDKVVSYETLIEQQAVIKRVSISKDGAHYELLNFKEFKESCFEKSQRFAQELQTQSDLTQVRNRSKQRDMDFGP